jgi:uncharacterized protein YqcC (DUF446 family)
MPPIDANDVRARLDAVIGAMKQKGAWDVERPRDEAFVEMGAFGMRAMAFEQWLRYVFVPNVEQLIASNGPWPTTSMVAVHAAREGDGNPAVSALVPALHAFDAMFEPAEPAPTAVPAVSPSPAAQAYARGVAAFERGDHGAALVAMREVLAIDSRFPNAHNYAGWVLLHWPSRTSTELDAATGYFREAMAVAPADGASLANLCDALVAAGREREAEAEAERETTSSEWNRAAAAYNWLGWRALGSADMIARAIELLRAATARRTWWGLARSNLAKALEIAGRGDEAYAEHATALACKDAFDRAFCYERRAAYETRHGWLRNALGSFRAALADDRERGGARQATYAEVIAWLESQLRARGVDVSDTNGVAWLRACELEIPAGFNARNELGEPLADDVIEVERLIRAERWTDAVAALEALRSSDYNKLIDAIGYASSGAMLAKRAGRRADAIAMQRLLVAAYEYYASGASSGGEGMTRTLDVERERAKLVAWERDDRDE